MDLFVEIIQQLARKHQLPKFRLGWFYSEVPKHVLTERLTQHEAIDGLDERPPLDAATLATTDRVVAVAGVHPYIALLDAGADVIIGGRSSDCAIFAAPAIRAGFPEALAYYYGKVLECASFCAEPYAGQGIRAGRNHHGGRQGDRAAAGATLHHRFGRRACDVRTLQSVLRTRARRRARHDRMRL